jgi:hypothetical protein
MAEPDATIGDLIGRLTDDSKRLVGDEVRLAKLELGESIHLGARGAMWLALAFGVGILALVSATIALVAGIGRIANGNLWVGALVVGLLEAGIGAWLIVRGRKAFGTPSYTLGESREELRNTRAWLANRTT